MNGTKLITAISLAVAVMTMIASDQLSTYATPTTEDDGYTYPDDASEEEKEEIDEREQEAGEDAGRPGDNNDDDDDDNDAKSNDNNNRPAVSTPIIKSSRVNAPELAITPENSYCYDAGREENGDPFVSELYQNCLKANWGEVYYQGVIDGCMERGNSVTGNSKEDCERWYGLSTAPHPVDRGGDKPTEDIACLYDTSLPQCTPVDGKCRDGYNMNEDGRCFSEHSRCPNGYHGHEDNESGECISNNTPCSQGYVMTVMANGGFNCEQKQQKVIVINSINTTTTETITPLPTSSTETTAADASNCKLDGSADGIQQKFDTAKYQSCKLHTNNDRIYYDGFVAGCMNVGNTKLICEAVADSSILNIIKTQMAQAQSAQDIQPTKVGES